MFDLQKNTISKCFFRSIHESVEKNVFYDFEGLLREDSLFYSLWHEHFHQQKSFNLKNFKMSSLKELKCY